MKLLYLSYMNTSKPSYILIALVFLISCKSTAQWEGQGPIQIIETTDKPVTIQTKQTFDAGEGVYFSNELEGARLNEVQRLNDTLIQVTILPENQPINPSPWYGFKIWSEQPQEFWIQFSYGGIGFHRYFPKSSLDGIDFVNVDSADFFQPKTEERRPEMGFLKVKSSKDTLWIAAQDRIGTSHVQQWKEELLKKDFVSKITIGKSKEGRPLEVLKIGEADDQEMLMVISMQHPPELTGFLAMEAFIEELVKDSPEAKKFRKKYNLYVMPQMNPDGVANGHWRHNVGGIDLNRDWVNFNQPETKALSDFMEKKVAETGGKFVFAADFHSTWEDIFYTNNEELEGNFPGLIPKVIKRSSKRIPGYVPNIRPNEGNQRSVTSNSYFFFVHQAESMTFEVGDNTPREIIAMKGQFLAEELMKILNKKNWK
ncbi:M14 family metallopeptidase [Algoriphagus zhangzhouensis]|uniref:Zinc carboxypeptidase n=1 Tax=Algoriphagus zhangzhouensis TaxID=1073327 RepID=A0A1M7Z789_9BACT|nr:M14 family metallopeptidase [Algoriphagus zhangzhouensis]TDY49264.1 zinc carboxypeptidase [Algoriphagus zhangzhouensis]SHO60682.1 Zinc carboxypeptidase [Algoriphagus zhangzhouensis]